MSAYCIWCVYETFTSSNSCNQCFTIINFNITYSEVCIAMFDDCSYIHTISNVYA